MLHILLAATTSLSSLFTIFSLRYFVQLFLRVCLVRFFIYTVSIYCRCMRTKISIKNYLRQIIWCQTFFKRFSLYIKPFWFFVWERESENICLRSNIILINFTSTSDTRKYARENSAFDENNSRYFWRSRRGRGGRSMNASSHVVEFNINVVGRKFEFYWPNLLS